MGAANAFLKQPHFFFCAVPLYALFGIPIAGWKPTYSCVIDPFIIVGQPTIDIGVANYSEKPSILLNILHGASNFELA